MNQLASVMELYQRLPVSKNLDESIGLSDGTVSKTAAVSKNLDESIGRQ